MAKTDKVDPTTRSVGAAPATSPVLPTTPIPEAPAGRGFRFYVRGGWLFFKKMWPAIYDLTTTETYVNASAIAFNVMLSFFSFAVLMGSFFINVLQWKRGYEASFLMMMSMAPKESGELFRSLDEVTRGPGGKATLFSLGGLYDFVIAKVVGVFGSTVDPNWRKYIFYVIGPIIYLPFVALVFFVIYYFVPNGKVQASQTMFTSIATALLWVIAMLAFWLALPLLDFEGSYKKLASLMALVTWVFISSFILILGANLSVHKVLPESWTGYMPLRRSAARAGAEVPK
jgi:uncharacterized BrkB/YihY/UPF0761 family membrane protein